MKRALTAAAIVALFVVCVRVGGDDPNPYAAAAASSAPAAAPELVQGKDVHWWARRTVQARKDANKRGLTIRWLRSVLAGDTTIQGAIDLAAVTYGVDAATLSRKASCESTGGHGYRPSARNLASGTLGLFQFKPSTWRSTPYAGFSPYDPLAAALAAGWMHAHGRGGEWVCR